MEPETLRRPAGPVVGWSLAAVGWSLAAVELPAAEWLPEAESLQAVDCFRSAVVSHHHCRHHRHHHTQQGHKPAQWQQPDGTR